MVRPCMCIAREDRSRGGYVCGVGNVACTSLCMGHGCAFGNANFLTSRKRCWVPLALIEYEAFCGAIGKSYVS